MNVRIDKVSKTSIYLQIASQLKREILSGEFNRGSTLPSERAMASILGVHRNTVVKAYNELKAEEIRATVRLTRVDAFTDQKTKK